MRLKILAFAVAFLLISNCSAGIPQTQATTTSSPQAVTALAQSLITLGGSVQISDVTLTGTAERIAGSTDETGTVTYRAVSTTNRLDLNLSGGTFTEIRTTGTSLGGTWIGPDGVSHGIVLHNLMNDPGWFPFFALAGINSSSSSLLTYIGQETRNGAPVIHVSASQQEFASPGSPIPALHQHLTQVDIYLDPSTSLPASYVFNTHPDNNALYDLPTEIRYSNYQTVSGVPVPFHVQKFINNCLLLDLQFQNASFNTGISVAQISGQ